jgi:hypothetical protein
MYNYLSSHYDSVIALHLSEKLSGTFANSCRAAESVSKQDVIFLLKHFAKALQNERKIKRTEFDKFYKWIDGLPQGEYDRMSLTDKCEEFFFKYQR